MAYYTLLARYHYGPQISDWGIEFGDYDRDTVLQEMDDRFNDEQNSACMMKVIKTATDKQTEINDLVACLNRELRNNGLGNKD